MGMQKIAISDATEQDLRLFATLVLGLAIKTKATPEVLRASIKTAWNQDYIVLNFDVSEQAAMIMGEPPANPNAQNGPKKWTKDEIERAAGRGFIDAPSSKDPRVTLVINETSGAQGKEAIFISINGRGILLPRRKQITIAYRHYLILQNAITDEVEQDFDAEMLVSNQVSRYPLNVSKLPTDEEIEAWNKLQAEACGQVYEPAA